MSQALKHSSTTEPLSIDTIEKSFARQDGWCVSLFMPTARAGKQIRESPIRLKNRIAEAEKQLEQAGVDASEINKICDPARKLCDLDSDSNREFWRHQWDGLAMLLSHGEMKTHQLDVEPDELTLVAHRFHIKPLLRAVQRDQEYCLLAVSQGDVRFLEGSRAGLTERPIEELPDSLQAVVRGDHQKGFNLHSVKVRSGDTDNAIPHGHIDKDHEHELERYFREINEALQEALQSDQRPMVFAGVAELFPFFREASEYKHLLSHPIPGNPDDLSPDDLHEKAWPMVAEQFKTREQETLERWNSIAHTDLAEDSLEAVLKAAHDGRIDTLILEKGVQAWGTYDSEKRTVHLAKESAADNYDLLDLAAIKTLQADGQVRFLDDEGLADGKHAVAICRYAM